MNGSGPVIHIDASIRTGEKDFIEAIRTCLTSSFPEQAVGLGGVFLVQNGAIRSHIMPGFPEVSVSFCSMARELKGMQGPMTIPFMIEDWLRYRTETLPLVCQSTILSNALGTDCRLEHTHFWSSDRTTGGHYHQDTTPDTIHYSAFFVPASVLHQVRFSPQP